MVDSVKLVNESFSVAGHVTSEQLTKSTQEGFKSVLNIRSIDEQGFPGNE